MKEYGVERWACSRRSYIGSKVISYAEHCTNSKHDYWRKEASSISKHGIGDAYLDCPNQMNVGSVVLEATLPFFAFAHIVAVSKPDECQG